MFYLPGMSMIEIISPTSKLISSLACDTYLRTEYAAATAGVLIDDESSFATNSLCPGKVISTHMLMGHDNLEYNIKVHL